MKGIGQHISAGYIRNIQITCPHFREVYSEGIWNVLFLSQCSVLALAPPRFKDDLSSGRSNINLALADCTCRMHEGNMLQKFF